MGVISQRPNSPGLYRINRQLSELADRKIDGWGYGIFSITEAIMTEEIDYKEWLTREVYARYGLAMYFAQCVERGLAILLTAIEIGRKVKKRSDYDLLLDINFKKTLGRLKELLEKEMKVDHKLKDELEEILRLRNYLAHNYFWHHGINFMKKDGCQRMLSELEYITTKLENANKTIKSITSVIRKRYGITDEKLSKIQKGLLTKYYL